MKVASFDIVFQEIPGEVTLALNLSNCPCHCPGCHSPHLAEDIGEPVDEELLGGLIDRYKGLITCVAFMGGDANPVKLGPYIESLGGLKSPTTNQRLYKRVGDGWEDVTASFWKKNL